MQLPAGECAGLGEAKSVTEVELTVGVGVWVIEGTNTACSVGMTCEYRHSCYSAHVVFCREMYVPATTPASWLAHCQLIT